MKKRILVTGANGFVGRALCQQLLESQYEVHALFRNKNAKNACQFLNNSRLRSHIVGDLTQFQNWLPLCEGMDAVVHLAARVHQMQETADDPHTAYKKMNVDVTHQLAQAAGELKVSHFVFLSSIKVNGEFTDPDHPYFTESDHPHPEGTYARSKWQAEQRIQSIARNTAMNVTILRPPLIYGQGVRANFRKLIQLTRSGIPLPLRGIQNRRNLLYVGNLISAIQQSIEKNIKGINTYLISDDQGYSTPDLIHYIAKSYAFPCRLIAIPEKLLKLAGKLCRQTDTINRLTHSLCVNNTLIKTKIGWVPGYTLFEGLQEMAQREAQD